ncbi:hypothetical protein JTE90_024594 [Oedothorax gibbosus]|uniref:Uncharacterized protein n=1 Tax=Oedothorax gibbosus TaxID=931172 RepID=A0AAV6VD39_9ARAC|nr:hypothetical protein JTE90_024594 [Oedothorax gibbosus]
MQPETFNNTTPPTTEPSSGTHIPNNDARERSLAQISVSPTNPRIPSETLKKGLNEATKPPTPRGGPKERDDEGSYKDLR